MAQAEMQPSLVEQLKRDHVRMKDLGAALELLQQRFRAAGIPWGVIGALAMRPYGYVRYTEDIDILIAAADLARLHDEAFRLGLRPRFAEARKSFRVVEQGVQLDVITAGELVGGEGSPIAYPHPESERFLEREGQRYPRLETVIEFKLASGRWGHRLKDHADVIELIRLNRLDEEFAACLHEELRGHFLELLALSRRERRREE